LLTAAEKNESGKGVYGTIKRYEAITVAGETVLIERAAAEDGAGAYSP
jgi:hypothetical protein